MVGLPTEAGYCIFGRWSSPLIQAWMSDIRIGSAPSHLTHLNFRPPVLTTMKCIGLRYFGQVGGGGFFGMGTLRLAAGVHSIHVG